MTISCRRRAINSRPARAHARLRAVDRAAPRRRSRAAPSGDMVTGTEWSRQRRGIRMTVAQHRGRRRRACAQRTYVLRFSCTAKEERRLARLLAIRSPDLTACYVRQLLQDTVGEFRKAMHFSLGCAAMNTNTTLAPRTRTRHPNFACPGNFCFHRR